MFKPIAPLGEGSVKLEISSRAWDRSLGRTRVSIIDHPIIGTMFAFALA